jgi:hypothetical protein
MSLDRAWIRQQLREMGQQVITTARHWLPVQAVEAQPPQLEWFLRSDGTPAPGIRDPATGRFREIDLDTLPVWRRTQINLGGVSR